MFVSPLNRTVMFKLFSSKRQYHLAFATVKTFNKFQLINSYVVPVTLVLLLNYANLWQLWYREGKTSKHKVLTFQFIFENKHHLLRGLLIYLICIAIASPILPKDKGMFIAGEGPYLKLVQKSNVQLWQMDVVAASLRRNPCTTSLPWGPAPVQTASQSERHGWRSWRRRQVDFVSGYQKSDSVGTRASCERSQELLGVCM